MRPAAAEQGCPDGSPWPRWAPSAFPFPASTKFPAAQQPQQPAPRPSAGRSVGGDRLDPVSQDRGRGQPAQPAGGRRCRGDLPAEGRRRLLKSLHANQCGVIVWGNNWAVAKFAPRWNKPRSWRSISATATAAAPAVFSRIAACPCGCNRGAAGRRSGLGRRHLIQAQFDQVQQGPYTRWPNADGRTRPAAGAGRNSSGTSTSRPAARSSWQGPAARIAYPIPWRAPASASARR